jgi:hypothetical protein
MPSFICYIYIRARAKNASKCSAVSDDDDDESSFPKEGMDKTQIINPKLTKNKKTEIHHLVER